MAIRPSGDNVHFTASKTEPKKIVKEALSHTELDKEIPSNVNRKMVKIWGKSKTDLSRLTNVTINKDKVLSPEITHEVTEGTSGEAGTDYLERKVFDSILAASNKDEILAQKTVNLLQQNVATEALMDAFPKTTEEKGWRKINANYDVNITGDNVEIIEEHIYQTYSRVDPFDDSQKSYFKTKLVISGKAEDIKQNNIDKIKVKYVTTDEGKVEEKVRKATYPMLKAFPDTGTKFT